MRVLPIACLNDNYAYLVVCESTGEAAIVDPSEGDVVIRAIEEEKVELRAIWATHHHWDHVGGNEQVVGRYGVEVIGHVSDLGRIPGQTRAVEEGEQFALGHLRVRTHHIPGHTLGAIAYVVSGDEGPASVFTGDTLFLAGCGRLFEGTPAQMHASLGKLAALPGETRIYCGHEYTEQNLKFAAHVEPDNPHVERARAQARTQREQGLPTVPGTVADELKINPFLRVQSATVRRTLGIRPEADDVSAFGAIRAAKDQFR